jgi:MSHA biogenesis protein MshJ
MNQPLAERYQQILLKFSAFSKRERLLTLIAVMSLVLLGGYVMLIEPRLLMLDKKKLEVDRQTTEIARLDSQVAELQQSLLTDPDAPNKARLASVKKQINNANKSLAKKTEDLVPATQMPMLLENVFAQFDRLKLMGMRSIAPTAMLEVDEKEGSTDVNLYQHGVQMTLQGRYFDIQKYLQRVESLPYQFYWKKFSYEVADYPIAEVQVEIYTLSTNRAFIGVWNNE